MTAMTDMNWMVIYPEALLLLLACVVAIADLFVSDPRRRPTFWMTQASFAAVAAMHLAFYDGGSFPAAYKGQMFVALHGSWNRSTKSGFKVVQVDPKSGKVSDFMTGFLKGQTAQGRPVDLVVASEAAGFHKPDPRIFQHALQLAGVQPAEAVMIGDWLPVDVTGAQEAGMRGIWFNPHGRPPPSGPAPDAVVQCYDELAAVIEKLG